MKIDIKTMLLTFGLCILFAFTAGDILTVKPATPKSVFAVHCYSDDAAFYVRKYTQQGYVFKSYSGGHSTMVLLVMEKY